MHYGADYNPEQWPREVWPEDVRLMREAGVTLVSLGIFAWSRIQPAEGEFDWDWLDEIIGLLHEGGIEVDLATATASPPPWASAAYPEMLPQDADGSTFWPGSRQAFAPSSPIYRRLAAELVTALAERYAQHPGVTLWHVNNEYGCHLHYDYSDAARDHFRTWLRRKYETVDALNHAWGTDFWSQRYTAFDEIVPPRKAPYSINPTSVLDFKRFTSDTLLELYVMERDIIRAAGATQPITTNFMGAFPPADYWKWAAEVDVICDDNYPDPNDPESFRGAAFARELMRGLKPGVPWLLTEQSTNALNWRPTNAPKAPGQMAAISAQAVGRGADAIMFFQWRQSRRGSEKFHSAMLPQAGLETRTWREVTALGAQLAQLPDLPDVTSGAKIALVFDWENWWAIDGRDHPIVLDYLTLSHRWHAALHRQNLSVDIVNTTSDLSAYSLVVAPQQYLLGDEGAANLSRYVEQGGHLFVSAFSDVVDQDDAFRDGGFLVSLRAVLGVALEDFGALVPPASVRGADSAGEVASHASVGGPGQSEAPLESPAGRIVGQYFAEELLVQDAEVLGRFTEGRTAGRAALTRHTFGAGLGYYLATIPDDDGMAAVLGWLAAEAGVSPEIEGLPEHVEVARRGSILTVINHSAQPYAVDIEGVDLLDGSTEPRRELDAFGWAFLDTGAGSSARGGR
ncbi:beta-galactosidase [Microbacterium foliorum]|uniref:beta-galactosidase n=1 Tax=Microbacterium foliorum TaxID=104336 RepID=UPI001DB7B523|nr:beta-galactosidase [Microbacterium foliorum]CAH0225388.1 Beta-galactosidase bgaB [Microbacterium foliorum]CAH0228008.1 Beta-galactosidase bgaB [Microbacterium foliorum]